MIHPSYTELMAVINSEVEEGEQPLVQSRYSIVRQLLTELRKLLMQEALKRRLQRQELKQATRKKRKIRTRIRLRRRESLGKMRESFRLELLL